MIKVEHYDNGNIRKIEIKNEKGELHNEDGPAYQVWYKNGQESFRKHFIEGVLHNDNGPIHQSWYENGQERDRFYPLNGNSLTEEDFYKRTNTVEVHANGKTVRISGKSEKELGII